MKRAIRYAGITVGILALGTFAAKKTLDYLFAFPPPPTRPPRDYG